MPWERFIKPVLENLNNIRKIDLFTIGRFILQDVKKSDTRHWYCQVFLHSSFFVFSISYCLHRFSLLPGMYFDSKRNGVMNEKLTKGKI